MKRRFSATSLRLTLSLSLLVIMIITGVSVHLAGDWLHSLATDVSHASADAQASHTTISTLQRLQEELAANQAVIDRASNIVAESKSYQYQDEIIHDLNNYAASAGITITNFNFNSEPTEGSGSTGVQAPTGINSTMVAVSIQNPVSYDNLLRLFHSIEQNLTKMQITNIALTKDTGDAISSSDLVIEVYIR